jgi:hypothetical protein
VDLVTSLEGFREEAYEEGEVQLEIVTEVANVSINEGILTGLYFYDYVVHNYHRGKVLPSPAIKEVLFAFTEIEELVHLVVVDKKAIANRLANCLSEDRLRGDGGRRGGQDTPGDSEGVPPEQT